MCEAEDLRHGRKTEEKKSCRYENQQSSEGETMVTQVTWLKVWSEREQWCALSRDLLEDFLKDICGDSRPTVLYVRQFLRDDPSYIGLRKYPE